MSSFQPEWSWACEEVAERVNEVQGCIPVSTRQAVLLIPEGSFQTGGAGGVCEGVQKRSFLTLKATMASGKKDRFTGGDGNVKRIGVP